MKLKIIGIDYARFAFSLFICAFHFFQGQSWIDWAWIFTTFYFLVSGFVLYEQINSQGGDNTFFHFAIRRVARIYPTLIFCILLRFSLAIFELISEIYSGETGYSPAFSKSFPIDYLLTFFLLQYLLPVTTFLITPLWSLAAEFWVSLMTFLFAGFSSRFKILAGILLGITMIILSGYLFDNGFMDWSEVSTWIFGIGRVILFFFVGGFMRSISKDLLRIKLTYLNISTGFSLILSALAWINFKSIFLIPSAICFISLLSLLFKLGDWRESDQSSRVGVFLGKMAYPIFALHLLFYYPAPFIEQLSGRIVSFLILTSATCIVAAIFVKYFEKRMARVVYKLNGIKKS